MEWASKDAPTGVEFRVTAQALSQFQNAVRLKSGWYHKLLMTESNLGIKWAIEAGLLGSQQDAPNEREVEVVNAALRELENEARRIIYHDYLIDVTPRFAHMEPKYDSRTVKSAVRKRLNFVHNSTFAISPLKMRENVGVFISDGMIPVPLHHELVARLDALAAVEPKDFHPGTNGKVQDLIHPSLYPFVMGKTPTIYHSTAEGGVFRTETSTEPKIVFESASSWVPTTFFVSDDGDDVEIQSYINGLGPREHFSELYHLIEQVFLFVIPHLQRTLDFKYVPEHSPSGNAFHCLMFEDPPTIEAVHRWYERAALRESQPTYKEWKRMLAQQNAAKLKALAAQDAENASARAEYLLERTNSSMFRRPLSAGPLHGRSLQVIVKAANYILRPGEEYNGAWHIEGMPHEHIVASAIYYYDADPDIVDRGLSLRRLRRSGDFPDRYTYLSHNDFSVRFSRKVTTKRSRKGSQLSDQDKDSDSEEEIPWRLDDYPSDWEEATGPESTTTSNLSRNINIGTIPTSIFPANDDKVNGAQLNNPTTGKIVSFPNWIQHRVLGISNPLTSAKVSQRKILCFFLVDEYNMLSKGVSDYSGLLYTRIDGNTVLTSSEISLQMRISNFPTLRWLLSNICQHLTGMLLSPELSEKILLSDDFGITREMAEDRRRAVMQDRRIQQGGVDGIRVPYSLCEH